MLFKLSADNGNIVCKELYLPDFFFACIFARFWKKNGRHYMKLKTKMRNYNYIYCIFYLDLYFLSHIGSLSHLKGKRKNNTKGEIKNLKIPKRKKKFP